MNQNLLCCMKKDARECLRCGRLALFLCLMAGIGLMIMGFTFVFSDIPEQLWAQLPGFNIENLEELVSELYPKMLRENIGIYSYYVGVFFSLIVIIVIHGILPREEEGGKWILPLQQGYDVRELILSKILVYGGFAGCSVFAGYLLYFILAGSFMERNMVFGHALANGLVHGWNMFVIVAYTLLLSELMPNPVISAVSMIATIMLMPDIATYFDFGKYLPTYPLTFVYDSRDDLGSLPMPMILNVMVLALLWIILSEREEKRLRAIAASGSEE
ncbi:MAG: hypothetical protein K6E84_01175 [Lachnospiraceae bacterium]|nr:hypothetical protein [Lachnospiraceae bacterium]